MASSILDSVRRNHALEHATVTMLLEARSPTPLGGYSTPGGFFIFGRASLEEVHAAAQKALASLQAGRAELAISPHCGTNIATAALLGGLLARAILARVSLRPPSGRAQTSSSWRLMDARDGRSGPSARLPTTSCTPHRFRC